MKHVNQITGKGFLEINWQEGSATLTTVTKDSKDVYDFFKELEKFNGKQINFSLREENELSTVED